MKNKLSIAMTLALIMAMLATSLALADGTPTIASDLPDYGPGDTVTLFGASWQAGEAVHIYVNDNVGSTWSLNSNPDPVADDNGGFTYQFQLPSWFVATYSVTATGSSGQLATTTFTDSVTSVTITAPTTASPVTVTSLPANVTVSFSYVASPSGTTSAQADVLGTGVTASKNLASGSGSDSIVVSIPAGTANGSYNVKVTVTNNFGTSANQKNDNQNNAIIVNVPTDNTSPTISCTVPDQTIWYGDDVTVPCIASDSGSGLANPSDASFSLSTSVSGGTEAASASTNSHQVCDNNNNCATAGPYIFKVDKKAPSVSATPDRSADFGGWYNHALIITFSGTDDGSGVASCDAPANYNSPDNASASVSGSCTDSVGNSASASFGFKYDGTAPTVALSVTGGTAGTNGWYTSDVTVHTSGSGSVSGVTCTADQFQTDETMGVTFYGSCTSGAGLTTDSAPLTVKLDKTGPSASLAVTVGTLGSNGWYTSDVTVGTSGTDSISSPVTCTADQFQTTETTGATFNGSCTNDAGLSTNAAPLTVKLDKTGPTATLAVTAGTLGLNDWYTSDVTVSTSGNDSVSSPVTCTADQYQTTDTASATFNGSCTNDAGLTTSAAPLTIKRDATAPTGVSGAPNRVPDHNSWYNHAVDVVFAGSDATSGIASCTTINYSGPDGSGVAVDGSCMDNAGNTSALVASSVFDYDATAPTITITTPADGGSYILNEALASDYSCSDETSGVDTCAGPVANGANISTNPVNAHSFTVNATDRAGNTASTTSNYSIAYAVGSMCYGGPGHTILQPINVDGSSVFKQKSTVPAKFRVCDASGVSIGTPGVVSSFKLIQIINGTTSNVDEVVDSTTPDTAFRWSSTDQQWIFNINTKNLSAGKTYVYLITLNDGSTIPFQFGLK